MHVPPDHPPIDFLFGINPVFEAIRARRRKIRRAFLNQAQDKHPRLTKLAELIQKAGIELVWTDKQELSDRARTFEHQGAVLECSLYPYLRLDEADDTDPRCLLIDNIEDPHNLGAILRTAEAFGWKQVFLPMRGVPDVYPSVIKASAGAAEYLHIVRSASENKYAKWAQEKGYKLLALDMAGKVSLDDYAPAADEKIMLVVGGEDKSVGQFILNAADAVVKIPQTGRISSLNASVSAAIAIHTLSRRPPTVG